MTFPVMRRAALGAVAVVCVVGSGLLAPSATAAPPALSVARSAAGSSRPGLCAPSAVAIAFSDALDKVSADGAVVGGLSDIAYDPRTKSYVSSVDNHLSDPSRLWFYRNLLSPGIVREPLVLRQPDGTAYTGLTADNEGLAVLPDGDFLVSSETEPSIRIFGRDGIQKSELQVPARFRVAPAGEATGNATLEGLTISPDGRRIVAAMEGTLSGDEPPGSTAGTYRRFLVYHRTARGGYDLAKQIGYQVVAGNRISEVQLYDNDKLLVMEAAFSPSVGNTVQLYAVTAVGAARDVTAVKDLSTSPGLVVHKKLVADITKCPTLGATAKQTQTNPLMDNYEGLTTRRLPLLNAYALSLISDDNFGPTQITRVLDLVAFLP